MSHCSDIIAAKDAQICVLREVVSEQQDRILELERQLDEMTAARDELRGELDEVVEAVAGFYDRRTLPI